MAGGLIFVLLICFAANAGRLLVVDAPERSDVILVLAGETDRRPAKALELLNQGFGHGVVIDVPAEARIYDSTQIQLAERYIHDLPQAAAIRICPIEGLSTRDEARDVARCLDEQDRRILIVTSDFHTRRALSVLRREIPGKTFSVAASRDSAQFGTRWWTHRQWAKVCAEEWLRVVWWNAIDRWH